MLRPGTKNCNSEPIGIDFGGLLYGRRGGDGLPAVGQRAFPMLQLHGAWPAGSSRILIRPRPGFYVMRLRSGAPLVPAVIYQLCPMVLPQPMTVSGPHPDEWCRPLDRSPRYETRINDKRVDIDRVWTARSLRAVSLGEFQFRMGPVRRWARQTPGAPEARPERPVDLNRLPPLF